MSEPSPERVKEIFNQAVDLPPEEAGGHAFRRIVDKMFQGSAEMALARLVAERPLSNDEVERLKALLDSLATSGDG